MCGLPARTLTSSISRAVEEYGVDYIKGQVGKVIPQPDGKLYGTGSGPAG